MESLEENRCMTASVPIFYPVGAHEITDVDPASFPVGDGDWALSMADGGADQDSRFLRPQWFLGRTGRLRNLTRRFSSQAT